MPRMAAAAELALAALALAPGMVVKHVGEKALSVLGRK